MTTDGSRTLTQTHGLAYVRRTDRQTDRQTHGQTYGKTTNRHTGTRKKEPSQ